MRARWPVKRGLINGGEGRKRRSAALTLRAAATYLPRSLLLLLFVFCFFYFIYSFIVSFRLASTVRYFGRRTKTANDPEKGWLVFYQTRRHMRATMAFDGTVPAQTISNSLMYMCFHTVCCACGFWFVRAKMRTLGVCVCVCVWTRPVDTLIYGSVTYLIKWNNSSRLINRSLNNTRTVHAVRDAHSE